MKISKKISEESQEKQPATEMFPIIMPDSVLPELRVIGIYGDISEEKCSEAVYGLYAYHLSGMKQEPIEPENKNSELVETYEEIEFIVSSHGGLAAEMFSVYDVIRDLRDKSPIHTKGLGKVMSAGVLLLASGTKGKRKIGKHCRVMMHGVVAGQHGYLADVENEFKETKYIQNMYIKALADETNMTEKYIRKLMSKKTNVYLNAEEAVKLGIADIIF